jgi:DNA (cytosine-5)-methyltransferase 1
MSKTKLLRQPLRVKKKRAGSTMDSLKRKRFDAASCVEDHPRRSDHVPNIKALSFFSGAMGLDLGLERSGIHVLTVCEVDKASRRTIDANRPDIGLMGDIWKYDVEEIRHFAGLRSTDDIDLVVGGPPCQAFSTAGARKGFEDDRGNLLLKFIDQICKLKPRYAVIENVRGLLSAPLIHRPHSERKTGLRLVPAELPGGALLHALDKLRAAGYSASFNLYNAANFGAPQVRERVIILCARDGSRLPYLTPTHSNDPSFGLPPWRTVRDVIGNLRNKKHHHFDFPESRLRFYRMLSQGQYWKNLPKNLHAEALGNSYYAGGGKTGFLRRLAWDKPSPTLVTHPAMPATDLAHPVENRPLSIEEYKRIQEFPDDWIVCGSLADQYRQIGNAVPISLGYAIGLAVLSHIKGKDKHPDRFTNFPFSRYRNTDDASWEKSTRRMLTDHQAQIGFKFEVA